MSTRIRGRGRVLTDEMKVQLCALVAKSHTVEQAADMLDISLRTVQRERRDDEDFDHEVHLALQTRPDPKRLMETAARTHWRAAAWLLERTDPETYARRPLNSATTKQVDAALTFVLEAVLQAVPAELRSDLYDKGQAACEKAFDCTFPNIGPWGNVRTPKLPQTPLVDQHFRERASDPSRYRYLDDLDDSPAETTDEATTEAAVETTAFATLNLASDAITPTPPAPRPSQPLAPKHASPSQERNADAPLHAAEPHGDLNAADFSQSFLSPKMRAATKCDCGHKPIQAIQDLE